MWKVLVASVGEANRVLEHPFGFGLQISSAADFSGVSRLLGGILYLIMGRATDRYLALVSVLWAALKESSARS